MNNYDDLRVQLGLKPGNNANQGTSPYKNTSYSSTLSNNLSSTKNRKDEEERRRKEEEQKRQEAERRRKDQQRDAKLRAVEGLAHAETPSPTRETTRPTYSSHTLNKYSDNTIKNENYKDSPMYKSYKDYGVQLSNDLNSSRDI